MAHSIELLLDDKADAAVRLRWRSLDALGIRTPGATDSPTVRPHLTLLAGTGVRGADSGLAALAQRLPFPVTLGAPVLLPAGSHWTLALGVVPSTELLSVHATAFRLCGDAVTGLDDHGVPGSWTPHVTLARRVDGDGVSAAVAVLGGPIHGRAVAVRRWDGDAKSEQVVSGREC
ncbi:2'-5' RNA ligase family protein [Gordonia humi]|uniref:2'-5' RNA ligase n=1 Tax=Gordonia humi TaxID=686429 RepID=A0A840F2V4_9ACTN|nr:2'-5' RNA ligase [Gordonia humi]